MSRIKNTICSLGAGDHDWKILKLTSNGSFTVKSFYRFLIDRGKWCKAILIILKYFVPCKISAFNWLI